MIGKTSKVVKTSETNIRSKIGKKSKIIMTSMVPLSFTSHRHSSPKIGKTSKTSKANKTSKIKVKQVRKQRYIL
jgi:hypothetical protein